MTAEQRALFDKATLTLRTGRANLELDDPGAAANRAYYAAYYAATAALLGVGERPKSHAGTHRRFHHLFVTVGLLDAATGGLLVHAYSVRQRADYDLLAVTDARATADLLDDVERFIAAVREAVEAAR
ncbi:MAG TPA: HEPN domain-containing protein [Rhodothermales bacterium]|nr:HEPN domain-containing protein [Rhodothermales bacterium]